MEVLYDIDTEAGGLCRELGMNMIRAATVGTHPRYIQMIVELILERTMGAARQSVGRFGPEPDDCPSDCCPLATTYNPSGAPR
jgi:ferrochelatase